MMNINLLYSSVILMLLLFIICGGMKINQTDDKTTILRRFNNLRGGVALEIVIGHVVRYENTILYPLGKFMIISVAFFFFVSAFGMVCSFQSKKEYLKGFIVSKCGYLLSIATITYLISIGIALLVPVDIGYWEGKDFLIYNFFAETNWYIWELMLFYVLFYAIFRFIHKHRWLYFFIFTISLVTILFKMGWPEKWCASALAFAFGVLYGEYYEKTSKFIYSKKGIALTCLMVFMGLSSLTLGTDSLLGVVYLRNIMCIAALFILIYALKVLVPDNQVLKILLEYSTEIYLFQFIYLRISEGYGWDFKIRLPFVIFMTGITALIMHPILKKIKGYFKGVVVKPVSMGK